MNPPAGFERLLPIYLLKLLVGFTAKDVLNFGDTLNGD
jgi:hypothetical protein